MTSLKSPKVSEESKAWAAALATEVGAWPQVASRSFFGFTALYRRRTIFGLLPRTRGVRTPNSLAFKLESPVPRVRILLEQDPRVGATQVQKARWFTFELATDADLRDALYWLGQAHKAVGKLKESG